MILHTDDGDIFVEATGALRGFQVNSFTFDHEDLTRISMLNPVQLAQYMDRLMTKFPPLPPVKYRCCDHASRARCVCEYKTTCQRHGDICHGNHD